MKPLPMAEQPCGECQACCEAVGVHELKKPTNTKCQHQCKTGCGIYPTRPESCKTYFCLYQMGTFGDDTTLRPDKLGVILDLRASGTGDDVISAWEVRDGAADEPKASIVLNAFAENILVMVRRYKSDTKRRILGPPEKVRAITQLVEKF